jgi:hypothetical protein
LYPKNVQSLFTFRASSNSSLYELTPGTSFVEFAGDTRFGNAKKQIAPRSRSIDVTTNLKAGKKSATGIAGIQRVSIEKMPLEANLSDSG